MARANRRDVLTNGSTAGARGQPSIIDFVSSYRYRGSRLTQVLRAFRA